jgi:hypothetical protein
LCRAVVVPIAQQLHHGCNDDLREQRRYSITSSARAPRHLAAPHKDELAAG